MVLSSAETSSKVFLVVAPVAKCDFGTHCSLLAKSRALARPLHLPYLAPREEKNSFHDLRQHALACENSAVSQGRCGPNQEYVDRAGNGFGFWA